MSSVQVAGNASGTGVLTIQSPNTNTNYTLTLPSQTGTVVVGANANSVTLPGSTSGTMSIAAPAIAGLLAESRPSGSTARAANHRRTRHRENHAGDVRREGTAATTLRLPVHRRHEA